MKTHKLSILLGFVLGTLVLTPIYADSDKSKKEHRSEQRRDEAKTRHKDKQQKQYKREQRKSPQVNNRKSHPDQYKQKSREHKKQDKNYNRQDHRSVGTNRYSKPPRHEHTRSGYSKDRYIDRRHDYRDHRRDNRQYEYRHGRRLLRLTPRHRTFRNIYIVRPFGHSYFGYGHYLNDHNAWRWLTFTAITLKLLDMVDEQAQREHEAAQIAATTAEVGERIYWDTDDAHGYVETTRQGTSSRGLQCREYQQSITVGGETEEAYGSACLQPDGSWKVVD